MHVEPFGTELIERYLDSRGWRFFRGRTGREFLVLLSTGQGELHVNVRASGSRRDVLVVRVSPAAHYSAGDRSRLMELVNEWNRDTHWPKAFVRETSDPARVGVVGENSYPLGAGIHVEALGNFIEHTISCAAESFDKIADAVRVPSSQTLEAWLHHTG
jgi:hypothetical protein